MNTKPYIQVTKSWIEKIVIGLNLCPFAKPTFDKNKIQYIVSQAKTEPQLLEDFVLALQHLYTTPKIKTETTLIILPFVLLDFYEYLDFLEICNQVLIKANLEGVIQVASFHPNYQFDGTETDAIENYTNRSPYPMLHLLREESIEIARLVYPNVEEIPNRNIETMRKLGMDELRRILNQ